MLGYGLHHFVYTLTEFMWFMQKYRLSKYLPTSSDGDGK